MPGDQRVRAIQAEQFRRERPRDERRRTIAARLAPALEALLAEGAVYSDLSVAQLSRAAGTSRSRFYVYFEDSGDLLSVLTEDAVTELFHATLAWWALPPEKTWIDLRAVTDRIFSTYLRHRHLFTAVEQVATHDSAVRENFSALFNHALDGYAAEIARGQASGTLDRSLKAHRIAGLLASMTQSGLYELTATGQLDRPDPWIDSLTTIVWNSLYAPARDAPEHA